MWRKQPCWRQRSEVRIGRLVGDHRNGNSSSTTAGYRRGAKGTRLFCECSEVILAAFVRVWPPHSSLSKSENLNFQNFYNLQRRYQRHRDFKTVVMWDDVCLVPVSRPGDALSTVHSLSTLDTVGELEGCVTGGGGNRDRGMKEWLSISVGKMWYLLITPHFKRLYLIYLMFCVRRVLLKLKIASAGKLSLRFSQKYWTGRRENIPLPCRILPLMWITSIITITWVNKAEQRGRVTVGFYCWGRKLLGPLSSGPVCVCLCAFFLP